MANAQDVITAALKKLKVLRSGEVPSAEDAEDCLTALNVMLDAWSHEGLMIYALTEDSKALTEGDPDYTIGTGGDIATARPDEVEAKNCFIRDSNNNDSPLAQMTDQEYNQIALKDDNNNATPTHLLYRPEYPLGKVILYPPPSASLTLYLYSLKPFTAFSELTGALSLPPMYQAALEFNLAVWVAPDFGKEPSRQVVEMASSFKSSIKSKARARRPLIAAIDLPCGMGSIGGTLESGWR